MKPIKDFLNQGDELLKALEPKKLPKPVFNPKPFNKMFRKIRRSMA